MANGGNNGSISPPINSVALWQWDTTGAVPVVTGYPQGNGGFAATKTGLLPADLQAYVGIPIQLYTNPPTPIALATQQQWIRWAEDFVEQQTSLLLCQSWVAGPPAQTPAACLATSIVPTFSGGYQVQGYDYDIEDPAYDFFFPRAQDEGWMVQSLRFRPVRSVTYVPGDPTAVKRIAYIYPLLNEFFQVPYSWIVEDRDQGLIRLVPATNVQMLPLFAMQLAFMGFAETVPGGLWFQYTAGLTQNDYLSRYAFVKQLVLAQASIMALSAIQGTINYGAEAYSMTVDGLQYQTKYGAAPFAGLIKQFTGIRDSLLATARDLVSGPMVITL